MRDHVTLASAALGRPLIEGPSMAGMVAATIPFSLLFALFLMYLANIPIGLLSIGAIDFWIIVDGAVIMADHVAYRLSRLGNRPEKEAVRAEVARAASEVQHPVFFSMMMIIGAYLPILTLTRIEGLLFRPMAITIAFALVGALLFSLFVVPVLSTLLMRRGFQEWENPLLRLCRPLYGASLRLLLKLRWLVMVVLVVASGTVTWIVVPTLGIEFLPYMDEGGHLGSRQLPGRNIDRSERHVWRIDPQPGDEIPGREFHLTTGRSQR